MTDKPKRPRTTTPKPPAEKVTLRDQLAMAALQGPLAGESHSRREQLAREAYSIADLMLDARAVEKEGA